MTIKDEELTELADQLGVVCLERNWVCSTAESCTGGLLAEAITRIDGSSKWFYGSSVCYANEAKENMLGVSSDDIVSQGAVSEVVAKAMVRGILYSDSVDVGIAVTGVAGPGGGTFSKPVGTVWLAWGTPHTGIEAIKYHFDGNRLSIRRQAAFMGLQGLLKRVRMRDTTHLM